MKVGVVMGLGGGSSKLILRCYAVALLGSGVLDELDDQEPKKQR